MENNKKYDDLILELIRTHRKYPQVKDFEQSITDDVYKRAQSILDTIADEETISEYLKKVVSISVIKVPQEQKISANVDTDGIIPNSPAISELNEPEDTLSVSEPEEEEEEEEEIPEQQELISEDINAEDDNIISNDVTDNDTISLDLPEQDLISEEELSESITTDAPDSDNTNTNTEDIVVYNDFITDETEVEDKNDTTPNNDEISDTISEQNSIEEPGISNATLNDEFTYSENEPEELAQEDDSILENTSTTELSDKMINSFSGEDYVDVIDLPESAGEQINYEPDDLGLVPIQEENISISDDLLESNDSNSSDLLVSDQIDDISLQENNTDTIEDLTPLTDADSFIDNQEIGDISECEDQNDTDIISEIPDNGIIEEVNEETEEYFNAEPEPVDDFSIEIDENRIQSDLCKLDAEFPHLHILNVFDLKYKKKDSIKDIAELLSITEDDVTESLYKIIDIIGD